MPGQQGVSRSHIRIATGHRASAAVSPHQAQHANRLITVDLPSGLPEDHNEVYAELEGYVQVLLGHMDAPLSSPYLALQEVATAYLSRGYELSMLIHRGESEGSIRRGSAYSLLRTRSLRDFIDMAKKLAE